MKTLYGIAALITVAWIGTAITETGWFAALAPLPVRAELSPEAKDQCDRLMTEFYARRAYLAASQRPVEEYASTMQGRADYWTKRTAYEAWFATYWQAITDSRAIVAMIRNAPTCFSGTTLREMEGRLAEMEQGFAMVNDTVRKGGLDWRERPFAGTEAAEFPHPRHAPPPSPAAHRAEGQRRLRAQRGAAIPGRRL